MARAIAIMGESGSGKTTSLRNLTPESTFIIDSDKKGLSWRGWKKDYNKDAKNYLVSDDPEIILKTLKVINAKFTHVHTIVVDTINGIMVADEARRRTEKSYDKWADLAWSIYGLVDYALVMRPDITVIFTAHTQTDMNDAGYEFTHIKTSGRKLDKIVLDSKFTTVLNTRFKDGEYIFETRSATSTAKAPFEALPETMPNDIVDVINSLNEYEG